MQEVGDGNGLDVSDNTNSDSPSVSVEDILATIDMFLENKYLDSVPSQFTLRLLRYRITNPEG